MYLILNVSNSLEHNSTTTGFPPRVKRVWGGGRRPQLDNKQTNKL